MSCLPLPAIPKEVLLSRMDTGMFSPRIKNEISRDSDLWGLETRNEQLIYLAENPNKNLISNMSIKQLSHIFDITTGNVCNIKCRGKKTKKVLGINLF